MIRPVEILNTALLAAITILLAILVLRGPAPERAVLTQAADMPTIPCRVTELFGGGEEHTCVPVRMLDAP